jgi:hypothetical protein
VAGQRSATSLPANCSSCPFTVFPTVVIGGHLQVLSDVYQAVSHRGDLASGDGAVGRSGGGSGRPGDEAAARTAVTSLQRVSLPGVVGSARRDTMGELVRLSGAESPVRRWRRRLLLVAAAGAGIWALGCLSQHTAAQAETASPMLAGPASSAGPGLAAASRGPVGALPGGSAGRIRSTAHQLGSAVPDGPGRGVPAPPQPPLAVAARLSAVPAVTLPVPPVGSTLLPPAHSGQPEPTPAATGPEGRQAGDVDQAGSRTSERSLNSSPTSERSVGSAPGCSVDEPAPHPGPVPVPGPPRPPANGAGHACGSPYSLPLGEPAAGPIPGSAAGLAAPRSATAAGVRQRAYLPDTPPD